MNGLALVLALTYVGGGALLIRFSRIVYRNPQEYLDTWFTGYFIPPIRWNRGLLRGFAIMWIVSAVWIVDAGLAQLLAFVPPPRTAIALAVCLAVALALVPWRAGSPAKHSGE